MLLTKISSEINTNILFSFSFLLPFPSLPFLFLYFLNHLASIGTVWSLPLRMAISKNKGVA